MSIQLFGLARLGRDCEIRKLTDGTAVTNLSLAFTYGKKGADDKRPTQWVEAALFGKQAESLAPYLLKGRIVSISLTDVHTEAYVKNDGTPQTKLAGRVTQIDLAGGASPAPAPAAPPPPPRRAAALPSTSFEDMDDDVPF